MSSGGASTVGGGQLNLASGNFSTVPGGSFNIASGGYCLAAGRRANAIHDGTFVWADSTDADFTSTAANQFLIKASGGVGIGTENPKDVLHLFRDTNTTVGVLMGNGFTGSDRRGFLVDYHHSGGAELWNIENTDMWFGTNNTRRMTIAADGDIGIGFAMLPSSRCTP